MPHRKIIKAREANRWLEEAQQRSHKELANVAQYGVARMQTLSWLPRIKEWGAASRTALVTWLGCAVLAVVARLEVGSMIARGAVFLNGGVLRDAAASLPLVNDLDVCVDIMAGGGNIACPRVQQARYRSTAHLVLRTLKIMFFGTDSRIVAELVVVTGGVVRLNVVACGSGVATHNGPNRLQLKEGREDKGPHVKRVFVECSAGIHPQLVTIAVPLEIVNYNYFKVRNTLEPYSVDINVNNLKLAPGAPHALKHTDTPGMYQSETVSYVLNECLNLRCRVFKVCEEQRKQDRRNVGWTVHDDQGACVCYGISKAGQGEQRA